MIHVICVRKRVRMRIYTSMTYSEARAYKEVGASSCTGNEDEYINELFLHAYQFSRSVVRI